MPQGFSWDALPDQSPSNVFDFSKLPDQPQQPQQPSSMDWWIEQGLRTAPAVIGGLGAGLIGGPIAGMAGGAGGSAFGTWLGDQYSGKQSSPTEYAVNTVLGGLPPMLGPAKLAGEGVGDLIKYGLKSAALSGLEGGVVGAGGVPFQHYAQTGNFDASPEEYLHGAGSGALFGTVLGGGMSAIHGIHAQNQLANIPPQGPWHGPELPPGPMHGPELPPTVMDPRAPNQGVFPFMNDPSLEQRPPAQPSMDPMQGNLFDSPDSSFTEPVQGDFTNQFGPYRGGRGRFRAEQPPFARAGDDNYQLPFDPYTSYEGVPRESPFQVGRVQEPVQFTGTPTMEDMAPPSLPKIPTTEAPPVEATVAQPDSSQYIRGVIFKDDLAIITEPRSAIAPMLAARGYEPIGVKDNYPTWQLKQNIAETPFARMATEPSTQPKPEGMQESPIPINENGHITVPARLATKGRLNDLVQKGYAVIEEHPNGDVTMGPAFNPDTDIARGKAEGGELVVTTNNRRAATNLTKDYSSALPGIMKREGMQNAFDAIKKLMGGGVIKVRNNEKNKTMEIHDNGHGMDENTLAYKLAELFSTGKENEEGASGGKGIGAASYILGGKHFEVNSVAIDAKDGRKYRIIASGTPEQFHDPVKGSDYSRVEVPMDTPTGTTIKTTYLDSERVGASLGRNMMRNIIQFSRDLPGKILWDRNGSQADIPLSDIQEGNPYFNEHAIQSSANDKLIGDFTIRNSEVKVKIPKFDDTVPHDVARVRYLNNGMYQFSDSISINKPAKGFPENVLVDIHPLVDEQSVDYPFTNTREQMKDDIREQIEKFLEKNIQGPAVERTKNRTQELYDAMANAPIPVPDPIRKPVFYDPGDRLTPTERQQFLDSRFVRQFVEHHDGVLEDILQAVGRPEWDQRLEGVGIILDPTSNGLHVPNPSTGKSSIGFNPFIRIEYMSPKDAAWANTITALHEAAHIGKESGSDVAFDYSSVDWSDPRIPKFMKAYADQMIQHGDVSYHDTGHRMDFMQRLGEVFSKYGVGETSRMADGLERIYTDGNKSGGYSPEIQKLLQIYTESRGRAETTDDLLSSTGVKQANRKSTGTGDVSGDAEGHGIGVPPTPVVIPPRVEKPSLTRQAYNFARGATTTGDLSAPLRQGLPLIFTKQFWTSLTHMRKSLGDEAAFNQTLKDLQSRPLFQRQYDPNTGKITKSFAEMSGMKLSDLKTLTSREEAVASDWVEKGGFLGSDVPYLNKETGLQKVYQQTAGRYARATNRAYTAFLNQLRADSFESLIGDAYKDFKAGTKGAKNPYTDVTYAREIADFVNTATGRGPLKLATPGVIGGRLGEGGKFGMVERSGEQFAKFFTDVIFSPRLMASRVRMLNPGTYMMASPFVRKQYIKSLLSVAGFAGVTGALAKGMGADVSLDPNSADFGKIRMGNTRLDMAGGFQQYLVAASRLMTGHTTSSASGKDFELGQGYRPPTRGDIVQNFMTNKLHPVVKFANDLVFASTHQPFQVGDRTLQLFVPLVVGDVLDLVKEDPSLLPLMAPIALGAGSQTYDKGASMSKFIPKANDLNFTGGEFIK